MQPHQAESMKTSYPCPVYAVVLAGGEGRRLWPLSRRNYPKQFLPLGKHGLTLLQEAARRAVLLTGTLETVLVIGQLAQAELVREQLPELPTENLILEPQGKNTAACLGLAAWHIHRRTRTATMVVLPADHLYVREQPWIEAVQAAILFACNNDRLVAIGIPPDNPSPNYGYLQKGEVIAASNDYPVHALSRYIEKPASAAAREYYESGKYLWNTGTFAWQVGVYQEALQRHMPDLYTGLEAIARHPNEFHTIYSSFDEISVDYGVMEKASNAAMVPASFQRIDVGSLESLAQVWQNDLQGNAFVGKIFSRDSRGNIAYTDHGMLALIGVEDLIVIRQGDVVLVCRKERSSQVKAIVAGLEKSGMEHYR